MGFACDELDVAEWHRGAADDLAGETLLGDGRLERTESSGAAAMDGSVAGQPAAAAQPSQPSKMMSPAEV